MDRELIDGTLAAAITETKAMLTENWPEVMAAYQKAYTAADEDAKFKFGVALSVKLTPKPEAIGVYAEIAFQVRTTDSSMGQTVDMHPQLPGV